MAITTENELSSLWQNACTEYAKETGIAFTDEAFPRLGGPEELSQHLEKEKEFFENFRMRRRPLLHAMQTVLAPFEAWGDVLASAASAACPPAYCIMGAMLMLVRGARKVSEAFDGILELFQKLGHFSLRLDSYKGVVLSEGIKTIIGKVMVNSLQVCAAAQKLLSRGFLRTRLAKWARNVFVEDTTVSSLLAELDELTAQEHMMVSAQVLKNTERLIQMEDRKAEQERLEKVKAALQPVSVSGQVFSSINESRIPGSGAWVEKEIRSWWSSSQPMLWIHGGPGVGKTYLASKIINDLQEFEPAPVVAYFLCKNNDIDLRSVNKALRTLAWQMASQQASFAIRAEEFCVRGDPQDSHMVWRKLLLDYLNASAEATCFVIDGIDEIDNEQQEVLFKLLGNTFSQDDGSSWPPLRLILLSRESVRGNFEKHSLSWVHEIEIGHDQNKEDLHGYISQRLQTRLFRDSPEFQEEIINEISRKAEGLWEWANLVISSIQHCRTQKQIRKVVRSVPRGISAMLHQELERLAKKLAASELPDFSDEEEPATQVDQLRILLSFVTLAQKPLTVEQLEAVLQIILKEQVLNLEEDLRTEYSSLFSIRVDDTGYYKQEVVTLRHSSFYEFIIKSGKESAIPLDLESAEASFLYVTLFAVVSPTGRDNSDDQLPWSMRSYAERFLPAHLERVSPQQAGRFQGEITGMLESLFSSVASSNPLVQEIDTSMFSDYLWYPSAEISDLGRYWFDANDRDTANKRAQLVLNWLRPEAKQRFLEHARLSEVASDACPFTILFSCLIDDWSRQWLGPAEIEEHDGLPGAVPDMLAVYHELAAEPADGQDRKLPDPSNRPNIVQLAEHQKKPQTPIWHARVAQALLLQFLLEDALDHFRISLDLHKSSPSLSSRSLSVIYRDMARTYTGLGRHKEAVEHFELYESLQLKDPEKDHQQETWMGADSITVLLHKARIKYSAKMTDDALDMADNTWKAFLASPSKYVRYHPDLGLFFSIFLDLHQPQRLRSMLDSAFKKLQPSASLDDGEFPLVDFAQVIRNSFISTTLVMYRTFHYALTASDNSYLDLLSDLPDGFEPQLYYLAKILFEKGRPSVGIQKWYDVATSTDNYFMMSEYTRTRSLGHLLRVCLDHTHIPFCDRPPIILDKGAEYGDTCLVISRWLQKHGDLQSARDVLRGRVRHCITLLSDNNPLNDKDAFMTLFKTFLVDPESLEDLSAALYLLKQEHERVIRARKPRLSAEDNQDDPQAGAQPELDEDEEGDQITVVPWGMLFCDPLTECSNCRIEIRFIHHWYFCRSCPNSTLCRRCYKQFQSGDPSFREICDSGHEFYYTGSWLKPSERVPEGMVPIVSNGERRTIWVEEWKDMLAEKWQAADWEFEGGLSAWVLRLLPEELKDRWRTFFQV
ncbi:hypothetical protein BJX61DRAFT_539736 [Aspergillus egyptiacus]|nr:hypothetical protein BJX61DRAFT_539736 [Aspergillus egyptiacus]